ncbi:BnaCnng75070D [Brassica napus]|uniref:BnaCnng75070D protein n=1 Tax=Brassica napus TaxID=3708 RepID=A0A078K2A5_BRANA|nr:BnaCnng75070D [Brassica napus]
MRRQQVITLRIIRWRGIGLLLTTLTIRHRGIMIVTIITEIMRMIVVINASHVGCNHVLIIVGTETMEGVVMQTESSEMSSREALAMEGLGVVWVLMTVHRPQDGEQNPGQRTRIKVGLIRARMMKLLGRMFLMDNRLGDWLL